MNPKKILVTGANGQIGSVLTQTLRSLFGTDQVITSDLAAPKNPNGPYEILDITDHQKTADLIQKHQITEVYHLAALLSAKGEANPMLTWRINLDAYLNLLELARDKKIQKIFFPSTIAVFGATTPREQTPQDVPLLPETVYGISKTSGELLSNYYAKKFDVDVRSLRYPGIIGYQTMPGGGTTDYAVEIFYEALKHKSYTCFLEADTRLPMMYIFDAIRATIEIMEAPKENVKLKYGYNLAAMSFTPHEIATEIKKHIPDFQISYAPDFRQAIAASWTESIDDQRARADWGWSHEFDLTSMVKDMLENIKL